VVSPLVLTSETPVAEPAETAESVLFGEAVACTLQARMRLLPAPLPPGALDAAERLLRDLAMAEERRGESEDATQPADPALRRLEAKLDLTLQLLAQALPGLAGPPPRPIRMSAVGVRFEGSTGVTAASGSLAVLAWQPSDGLPLTLHLPVSCLAQAAGRSWWRFEPLPLGLADLLERHVFRLHRRELAANRRS
jgi:hypothetical protein